MRSAVDTDAAHSDDIAAHIRVPGNNRFAHDTAVASVRDRITKFSNLEATGDVDTVYQIDVLVVGVTVRHAYEDLPFAPIIRRDRQRTSNRSDWAADRTRVAVITTDGDKDCLVDVAINPVAVSIDEALVGSVVITRISSAVVLAAVYEVVVQIVVVRLAFHEVAASARAFSYCVRNRAYGATPSAVIERGVGIRLATVRVPIDAISVRVGTRVDLTVRAVARWCAVSHGALIAAASTVIDIVV